MDTFIINRRSMDSLSSITCLRIRRRSAKLGRIGSMRSKNASIKKKKRSENHQRNKQPQTGAQLFKE